MEVFGDPMEMETVGNVSQIPVSNWSEQTSMSLLETDVGDAREMFLPWDNPNNIVSAETRRLTLFIIECICSPIIAVTGVVGNVMSFLVLMHHRMRGSVDVCLAALAVSDTMFLMTSLTRNLRCILSNFDYKASEWFFVHTFSTVYYLLAVSGRVTTLITVLVTFSRFIAVLYPLRARIWLTRKRMLLAIACIYVGCFLTMIPLLLSVTVGEVHDASLNSTRPVLTSTEIYRANRDLIQAYTDSFLIIAFRYIPAFFLVTLNTGIIVTLKRTSKKRSELSEKIEDGSNVDQRKLTVMLLVISMVFFVSLMAGNIFLIISVIDPRFDYMNIYHNTYMLTSGAVFVLEIINSSVNFIVYIALSKSFKDTYTRLFCWCFNRRKE